MCNFVLRRITPAKMNDYYQVDFKLSPASSDACDLLAEALADASYESFEPSDDGSSLSAYVPASSYSERAVTEAIEQLPIAVTVEWQSELVAGRDWNSEWERNYFKPILIAGKVAVHSSFHTDVPEALYDIVIDPRMAFGTGHHATTTLMMQALLDADVKGRRVIDMGTGTGILAILASMLGAEKTVAIEIDPFAAENARDNVALNLPENAKTVEVITGDASSLEGLDGFADIFLANINRNIITADISRYVNAMASGAMITVSGFYVEDRPVVAEAAAAAGLTAVSVAEMDNWSSMTFRKA